jgi:hypothetical protein
MSIGMTQDDNAQIGGRNELPASQAVEGLLVPERHGLGVRKTRSYDTFVTIPLLGMPQATPTSPILNWPATFLPGSIGRGSLARGYDSSQVLIVTHVSTILAVDRRSRFRTMRACLV